MGLNGGPKYQPNSSISYYVYCENEEKLLKYYAALSEKGSLLMPLNKYDWSEKYAWVIDQFGVNWQLDIAKINSKQKIVPNLLFAKAKMNLVKAAITFYTKSFKNSSVLQEANYPPEANQTNDTLLFAQFKLNDSLFNAMSSKLPHDFDFSPGNSFVVECENQQEIDYYWENLGQNGRYDMCGWLTDQFGISWQIVPSILSELMSDPEKRERVIQSFLKMQKFDIDALMNA